MGARTKKKNPSHRATIDARYQTFVASYLATLDATKSAIAAGYSTKGAKQVGSRLLRHPVVAQLLREKQAAVLAEIEAQTKAEVVQLDMSAERIKREIFTLAQLDPGLCFNPDGTPVAIHQLPAAVRACIKKVVARVDLLGNVTTSIEFWDKVRALDLAARHLNLILPPAREVNVNHKFPHAHLTDAELQQKLLEASNALASEG